jgi:glyoxylase-like metal-dependent hydrolase (beta-lactamase superfamily II)
MPMSAEPSPRPGQPVTLAPGLERVLAPNPSPMTERGTNSYILGDSQVVVIDPGPALPAHHAALMAALRGRKVAAIIVTHAHSDHSPAARPLAQATGAPVLAFGDAGAGRSARMSALGGMDLGGGEGVDAGFSPDIPVRDGEALDLGAARLRIHHTPGHMGNHICLSWEGGMFTGDQVMGWAPSLVSPPDGDLTDFMASLDRLEALAPGILYPGHGDPVQDGIGRIRALRAHRRGREAAILAAVTAGARTLNTVTAAVYTDVDPRLLPAAARNVLAHLIDLEGRGYLQADFAHPDVTLRRGG